MNKVERFAEKVQRETLESLNKRFPDSLVSHPNMWEKDAETSVRRGNKYTKVDVGRSGKYMVVNDTGEIFGIKGYGVIHKGKHYGTLDTIDGFWWGEYSAVRKGANCEN